MTAERGPGRPWPWLRRNVRAELALIAVALGVAAALVAMAPASGSDAAVAVPPAAPERVSDRVVVGAATLRYTVDPAQRRAEHAQRLPARRAAAVRTASATVVRAAIAARAEGIGPLLVALERIGRGHYVNSALELPVAGVWSLTVRVRVPNAAARTARITIPIG